MRRNAPRTAPWMQAIKACGNADMSTQLQDACVIPKQPRIQQMTNDKIKNGNNMQQCKQTAVVTCMPRCLLHQAVVSSPFTRMFEVAHPMTKLSSKTTLTATTPAMMTERDVLRMKRKITLCGRRRCACTSSTACLIRATNSRKQAKPAHAKRSDSGCDWIICRPTLHRTYSI